MSNDGKKEALSVELTESEKVQMSLMLERLNGLEKQIAQIRQATSDLITDIVMKRGLDTKTYGVNLAAGKVLPVEVK